MSKVRAPRKDFLVFGSPVIGEAEIAEVVDSLRSGWIGTGPKVQRFERLLEDTSASVTSAASPPALPR